MRAASQRRRLPLRRAHAAGRRRALRQGRELSQARRAGAARHDQPAPGQARRRDRATRAPRSRVPRRLPAFGALARRAARWAPSHAWRERARRRSQLTLVRGNHDDRAGDPPRQPGLHRRRRAAAARALRAVPSPAAGGRRLRAGRATGIRASASAAAPSSGCGCRASGSATTAAQLPAQAVGVLPAFGSFTGMHRIEPRAGDRIFPDRGRRGARAAGAACAVRRPHAPGCRCRSDTRLAAGAGERRDGRALEWDSHHSTKEFPHENAPCRPCPRRRRRLPRASRPGRFQPQQQHRRHGELGHRPAGRYLGLA